MKKNNLSLSIFILLTTLSSCSKNGVSDDGASLQPGFGLQTTFYQVNFWTQDPLNFGDNYIFVLSGIVMVSIGGQTKTLYYYLNSAGPASCEALGVLSFSLPPGTYSWNAWNKNNRDTIKGSVSIPLSAACVFKRIY